MRMTEMKDRKNIIRDNIEEHQEPLLSLDVLFCNMKH